MNKISRKLIKPNTPTPQTLKNYKISFLDGFQLPKNICVFLFYESKPEDSGQLEESLARILVDFYPLAGRFIKNDSLVDCSDQGAELVEAEAPGDVELIDLVTKIDIDRLNDLLPEQHFRFDEAPYNPLLSIQITRFSCGGAAVAISVSHRVFDASSLETFVAAWSTAANPDDGTAGRIIPRPSFHLPSLLPSKSREELAADLGGPRAPRTGPPGPDQKFVLKRLLFSNEALTGLKSRVTGKPVSGVRVVCAVIARALIRVDRAVHGGGRGSVVFQAVNMRERTIPPQSRDACGNFVIPTITRRIEGDDVGLVELVRLLGDSVRDAIAAHVEILSPDRDGRGIITNTVKNLIKHGYRAETNLIIVSDLTRFRFDEADFGWGKPVWSGIGPQQPLGNIVKLMRNKEGDGIEAIVMLKENEMCCFVQDEEIKIFMS
ncbi:pelargonidin 3-O-(6-caffeoylglucoside) 5-O-(6-O-malonylglucoside) 4'''-malonyltransferase-like [Salvia miltiorrhiza]|uniref:pelargonidin 3-O-(6-caffeoylglucoside) 5-O-(6-O-malonylglucoside) 4'''-malonyltransferase-like n=1 Tax=Salvia miltiorrhiza TaxID=226208 RepID=UPI0025AD6136|nr:pelargonidin 3-O-(6-caffeoylglucoside) 5-O-(6-O-malonylglucoside) 4'''-malonyltransferase-like [Salvia miltiorrhiza]